MQNGGSSSKLPSPSYPPCTLEYDINTGTKPSTVLKSFELLFHKIELIMLSKAPSEYVKTIPQHIRAAKQLESIRELKKGDKISFIKILNKPGVKPVELAKKEEIDSKKYMEFLESTLEQITSSMDLDFDTILGKPKQTGLDEFFWS